MGSSAVLVVAAVMLVLVGCVRLRRGPSQGMHRRGVVLLDGRQAQRRARRRQSRAAELTLAGVAIASADETKHFKLLGTTGTGKSTAIRELLGAALERGDRAVFADPTPCHD